MRIWGDCSTCPRCAVWVSRLWQMWGVRPATSLSPSWSPSSPRFNSGIEMCSAPPPPPRMQPGLESDHLQLGLKLLLQARLVPKLFPLELAQHPPIQPSIGLPCAPGSPPLGGVEPCLLLPMLFLCPSPLGLSFSHGHMRGWTLWQGWYSGNLGHPGAECVFSGNGMGTECTATGPGVSWVPASSPCMSSVGPQRVSEALPTRMGHLPPAGGGDPDRWGQSPWQHSSPGAWGPQAGWPVSSQGGQFEFREVIGLFPSRQSLSWLPVFYLSVPVTLPCPLIPFTCPADRSRKKVPHRQRGLVTVLRSQSWQEGDTECS